MNAEPRLPVYFISDLHLGAKYIPDPAAHERRAARFVESLIGRASELIMLGDVLDYWYEYRNVAPRGYLRFFGALARLADSGVKITWFIGNHDIWLFDYLRNEIGLEVVDGVLVREILGKRFLLTHGDGVGKLKPSFRFIRAMFRNRLCQILYSAIHPRWTIAFAHRWSASSRDFQGYAEKQFDPADEPFVDYCLDYLRKTGSRIDYFVFGHRHTLVDYPLPGTDSHMVILGDWITHFSYGIFDGREFRLDIFQ